MSRGSRTELATDWMLPMAAGSDAISLTVSQWINGDDHHNGMNAAPSTW